MKTSGQPVLHILCGKIASGKSTLAARLLRERRDAVLVAEDEWLAALYGDQMQNGADFMRCGAKLRAVIGPHVANLLQAGVTVVLDFQANTAESRAWMRDILERSGAAHVLHHLDVSDAVCLERLRARNAQGHHAFAATEAQFHAFTRHFAAPTASEGFDIVVHRPDG